MGLNLFGSSTEKKETYNDQRQIDESYTDSRQTDQSAINRDVLGQQVSGTGGDVSIFSSTTTTDLDAIQTAGDLADTALSMVQSQAEDLADYGADVVDGTFDMVAQVNADALDAIDRQSSKTFATVDQLTGDSLDLAGGMVDTVAGVSSDALDLADTALATVTELADSMGARAERLGQGAYEAADKITRSDSAALASDMVRWGGLAMAALVGLMIMGRMR